jgi:hypothetical protein
MKEITLWVAIGVMVLTMIFLFWLLVLHTAFTASIIRENFRALVTHFRRNRDTGSPRPAPRRSGP